MAENKRKYTPKNDVVFRMLFGNPKNEKTTKKLIEDILEEKVDQIDLSKTPFLYGKTADDKIGIIDVKAIINGDTPIDVEMQLANHENMEERILFYWARMYAGQIERGEEYNKLNRCISIIFLEEPLKSLEGLPVHTKWQIREEKTRTRILTNRLEIDIIKMSDIQEKDCEEELRKWLMFMDDPYGEEMEKVAEKKKEIKEAIEALDEINNDEVMAELAEAREKYLRDRRSEMYTAINKRTKARTRRRARGTVEKKQWQNLQKKKRNI